MASVFTFIPEYGASKNKKPSVSNIKFGDGYSQRISKGINSIADVWSVSFNNRSESEALAIDDFLSDLGGVDPFEWTPPGEAVPKLFICQDWNVQPVKHNLFSISAQFEQIFDPI